MAHHRRSVPLSEFPVHREGIVRSVAPEVAGQLVGFGLYPGVRILVRQTFPSLVVQADETELALEESLACQVQVEPAPRDRK